MQQNTSTRKRDNRAVLVVGVLFVATWIIGLVIAFPPAVTAPADTLTTFYQGHAALAMLQVYVANGLTGVLLLIFVAALHNAFRSADGESSTTSHILLMAGTVAVGLSCLEALFVLVLGTVITLAQEATLIRALLELNAEIDVFKLPALAMMIAAASILGRRANALPPWLVWLGAIEALALLVASASALFPGQLLVMVLYLSGIGLLVWTAVISLVVGWPHHTRAALPGHPDQVREPALSRASTR
jgi:hypothetical protein